MSSIPSFPSDLFAGKTVFITGGGSGINLGIAKHFAALGARIGICGRSQEKLDSARQALLALTPHVYARSADVRDPAAVAEAIEACGKELGPISVLVCGAAGNFLVPAEKLSPNGFKTVVDIDLLGSFNACHAAFPQLAETHGSIIFISAPQGHMPHAYQVHVGAAKSGVDNMMRSLALEWGKYGIRSNGIAPGPIADTEGHTRLAAESSHQATIDTTPLGRLGLVTDISAVAVYLASPMASFVTGNLLVVDGGHTLSGSAPFNAGAATYLANAPAR